MDSVFKGCTRPSLLMGVPMLPIMAVALPLILAAIWSLFLTPVLSLAFFLLLVLIYLWMRRISANDDQRLLQLFKRFKIRVGKHGSEKYWGAISYSPIKYKKRKRG